METIAKDQYYKIDRYFEWMYNTYKRFIGKNVLDIGVGFGTMTQYYVKDADIVIAVDLSEKRLAFVKERFRDYNVVTKVLNIESDDASSLREYEIDTIVCTNVIEHIQDDLKAVINMKNALSPGGRIIIMVPAIPSLYNDFDRNAGHLRRYGKGQLAELAQNADLNIIYQRYINILGVIPYRLKGKRNSKKGGRIEQAKKTGCSTHINERYSKLYNLATCILEPVEKIVSVPFGLSELIVPKKQDINTEKLENEDEVITEKNCQKGDYKTEA